MYKETPVFVAPYVLYWCIFELCCVFLDPEDEESYEESPVFLALYVTNWFVFDLVGHCLCRSPREAKEHHLCVWELGVHDVQLVQRSGSQHQYQVETHLEYSG